MKRELPKAYTDISAETTQHGETNDCAVKAVSLACEVPYGVAHNTLRSFGRVFGEGTYTHQTKQAFEALGYDVKWLYLDLKGVTTGNIKLPKGDTYLVETNTHTLVVKDGVVLDHSINRRFRVTSVYLVTKKVSEPSEVFEDKVVGNMKYALAYKNWRGETIVIKKTNRKDSNVQDIYHRGNEAESHGKCFYINL